MTALSQKQLKALINRRHPEYAAQRPHWEFLESTYKGGRSWFEQNIFQYHKEGNTEFKNRVKRAYRFNHTREVCDLVNKYLFRPEINRKHDEAPEAVKLFWESATFQGLDIKDFMWTASLRSSQVGRPWIIVDNANTDISENTSENEVREGSIYAYLVSPQQVLDMSFDDSGELNWILIEEHYREDENPLLADEGIKVRWRLWDRNNWTLIQKVKSKNGKERYIADSNPHNLGLVPAVKVDNVISAEQWSCPALIADIAYLDRACANYASNLDAIIQDQTFSQLAMPAQNLLPGEDGYNKVIEMGTKRVFLYDGEGGGMPGYLSPDPRQASLILAAIGTLINEIYHSVGLAGERTKQDNSKGIDNSSGVAKAHDFERVTALLRSKATSLETTENKLVKIVCKWAGANEPKADLVTYPETFDVRGIGDEFHTATQLKLIDAPSTVRAHHMKSLIDKLFPNLGESDRKKMMSEVEEWMKLLKERAESGELLDDLKAKTEEEATRDREGSGKVQSDSKRRETGEN